MKNMKFGFIGALAIAATMFFAGCADECKDIVCANGECVDGACVCDAGYEGTLCDAALNAKFTGSYSNTETCNPSGPAGPYTITLNPKSGSATEVNFVGLWEVPSNIVMGTVGTDGISFTIERQVITTGFDVSATGTSNADGSTINITYSVFETGVTTAADVCTAVLTK
ncbi:MAG: hypothetical protein KA239_03995 [Bacteroidia bacterium]|nr:hypothetical protein [Bacteroidota bacterium]MBP6640806.1 hypothetical protein [Bacteroidia bacterium]MBP6721459.1 hypothetical protein [Bacteroidia bacterium]